MYRIFWGVCAPKYPEFDEELAQSLDLTVANLPWQSRLSCFDEPLFISENLDSVLEQAWLSSCDYAVIQSSGHILHYEFLKALIDFIQSRSPLIVGHIIDEFDGTFSLDEQCLVLNLKVLRERGIPRWISTADSLPQFTRDSENIHDNYTPLKITTQSGRTPNHRHRGSGILALCQTGEVVYNFDFSLRNTKFHLYPTKPHYLERLSQLAERANQAKDFVFIWNSERLSEPRWPHGRIRNLIAVASGFKPFKILFENGFAENAKVTFVDNNPNQLAFMKALVQDWNGVDYHNFVTKFFRKHPNLSPAPLRFLKEEFNRDIDARIAENFGGPKEWLEFWRRVRKLDYSFCKIDLVDNPLGLVHFLPKGSGPTYLWLSGVFWYYSSLTIPFSKRFESFKRLYGICARAPEPVWVSGDDVFGQRRNETVREHLHYDARAAKSAFLAVESKHLTLDISSLREPASPPWKILNLEFPHEKMLEEAKYLFQNGYFVPHRSLFENNVGWFSTCLHGIDWWATNVPERYGHSNEMKWTEIAKLAPVTTQFVRNLSALTNLRRVRIMALLPGGQIAPHTDQKDPGFFSANFALNNPPGCHLYFKGYGSAPFKPGRALALDVSVEHWAVNRSNEVRFHLIPHGTWDQRFINSQS